MRGIVVLQLSLRAALPVLLDAPTRAQTPVEADLCVGSVIDYTTTPQVTACSSGGAVGGGMLTIHVHLPISAPIATLSSITVSEVGGGGHNAQPLVFSGPFTSGACPPGCPGSPSNPCFSLICGATSFHNGPHTISVAGSCWTFPGPPPMFMTQRPIQGQITVDIGNLVVAPMQPVNPEPILWHAEPGETVQLSATASAAYKALQPVKLTIYTSDQTPVKTFETTCAIGPGPTQLEFEWDGSQDPPLEGVAPKGIYLFRWEVGGPSPTMDYDVVKSTFLAVTSSTPEAELVSDDGTTAVYKVRYTLTNTSNRRASEGRIDVYGPDDVMYWTRPLSDDERTAGTHEVLVTVPTLTMAGIHHFLVCARDAHSELDRAHRLRWALQHNEATGVAASVVFSHNTTQSQAGYFANGMNAMRFGVIPGVGSQVIDPYIAPMRRALEYATEYHQLLKVAMFAGHGDPASTVELLVKGPHKPPIPLQSQKLVVGTTADAQKYLNKQDCLVLDTIYPQNGPPLKWLKLVILSGCGLGADQSVLPQRILALGASCVISLGSGTQNTNAVSVWLDGPIDEEEKGFLYLIRGTPTRPALTVGEAALQAYENEQAVLDGIGGMFNYGRLTMRRLGSGAFVLTNKHTWTE